MTTLERPAYLPDGELDVKTVDQPIWQPWRLKGIGMDQHETDGVFYFYDQPLVFAARIDEQLVIVTLTDEGYTNDGMKDGFAVNARGWQQHIAIPITEEILRKVYTSELPMRALYEQGEKAFFVHCDWTTLEVEGLDRFDYRHWFSVYRVWHNVEVKDEWKSNAGVYLNPRKKA